MAHGVGGPIHGGAEILGLDVREDVARDRKEEVRHDVRVGRVGGDRGAAGGGADGLAADLLVRMFP